VCANLPCSDRALLSSLDPSSCALLLLLLALDDVVVAVLGTFSAVSCLWPPLSPRDRYLGLVFSKFSTMLKKKIITNDRFFLTLLKREVRGEERDRRELRAGKGEGEREREEESKEEKKTGRS